MRPPHKFFRFKRSGSLPFTEEAAAEILYLPLFPALTVEQRQRVAAAIEASRHQMVSGDCRLGHSSSRPAA